MNNRVFLLWLVIMVQFLLPDTASAYDNTVTHRDLTANVVDTSFFKDYLVNALLIPEDIEKSLRGHRKEQTILRWLQEGSQMEDDPPCRASNHFHDPARPLNGAGLSDTFWFTSGWCSLGDYPFGELTSNLVWATGFTAAGQNVPSATGNTWDWHAARKFFYVALTGDSMELDGLKIAEGPWPWQKTTIAGQTGLNEPEREKYLAWAFRAMGNVLHLLQDVSVPAHVRNDFLSHRRINGLDKFNPVAWGIGNPYEHYVKHHNDLVENADQKPINFQNPKLTDFWDADGEQNTGLAELVNRSYFSSATIPNNNPEPEHLFAEPSLGPDTHSICVDSLPGKPDILRQYISREPCPAPGTDPVDHFAAVSSANEDIDIIPANISTIQLVLSDDNVLQDYAGEILPYALGYSIELLNYFFRGKIDMVPSRAGGYVIINESDEALSGGRLELFYDAVDGNRYPLNGAAWKIPEELAVIPAGGTSAPINFIPPGDAQKPGEYMLVYRGEMGSEKDTVVGKFVKRKKYLVMKRGSTYKQYVFWDIDRNEPARIRRAGSEEFIAYPTNPYGDPDVGAFFLAHHRLATEALFITEPLDFIYGDWVEDSYVFAPNGFPNPCEVCNAEYTEARTLIRTLLQAPYVEQVSSTVKELWTESWDCAYHQGYEQYVCDGQYSSAAGWETNETHDSLPYEPAMYDMRVVSGNVQKAIHHLVENSAVYAQNMNAEGQIILNLDSVYSSRIDGLGGRDHPTLGDIWGVHIRGIREEKTLNTWEIVTPWFVHSYPQLNSKVSETQSGRYYGVLNHMVPNFPSRSILTGYFNGDIIFRAYYLLYRRENALYASNGFPAEYEPPLVPGREEPFCVANSSILVTEDTSTVNPFTDMPDNPELSAAICDFWKTASAEDGRYNYAVTFEIWE
jgi:hypothetical protein